MNRRAFTLIELILALAACAVILAAVASVFSRAVHLRDQATARTRDARVRAHALAVLRNDLLNARITNFELTAILSGSQTSPAGGFPGYLKFTTTTAADDNPDLPAEDLQQVEYYITNDPNAADRRAGLLVRTVQRDLFTEVAETPPEQPLLAGVESMEVAFYDGTDWQETWDYDATNNPTVPEAVRVRLHLASPDSSTPPPLELVVPWTVKIPTKTENAAS